MSPAKCSDVYIYHIREIATPFHPTAVSQQVFHPTEVLTFTSGAVSGGTPGRSRWNQEETLRAPGPMHHNTALPGNWESTVLSDLISISFHPNKQSWLSEVGPTGPGEPAARGF